MKSIPDNIEKEEEYIALRLVTDRIQSHPRPPFPWPEENVGQQTGIKVSIVIVRGTEVTVANSRNEKGVWPVTINRSVITDQTG